MDKIQVFDTIDKVYQRLQKYIDSNEPICDRILDEEEEFQAGDGAGEPFADIGKGSNLTSLVYLFVTEDNGKEMFQFVEGIQIFSQYETALDDRVEYDNISKLVDGIRARISEQERTFYGASITPLFYTTQERHESTEDEAQDFAETFTGILNEASDDEDISEEGRSYHDSLKEKHQSLPDSLRERIFVIRGLSERERKEFEGLFFKN